MKFEESSRILIDIKDHKRVMETNHAFAAVMLLQLVPLVRGCPGVQKENQQLQFHGKAAAELFPLGDKMYCTARTENV